MPLVVDRSQPRQYGDEQGRYWSVSQAIGVVTGEKGYGSEQAMQRGTDVHEIFALAVGHHAGLCDPPDVPEEYAGYYRGILAWIEKMNPRPSGLERTMRHKVYPYAGTADFIGMIDEEFGVLDLKTGAPEKWHRLQLHAYQKMLDKAAKMWVLYVADDGVFKQVPIKPSARDWAAFQNGLSILQWREGA